MNIVMDTLRDYGLSQVYRSHQWHVDYPVLSLEGSLTIDALLLNIHFMDTAFMLGMLPELWQGEQVRLTLSPGAATLVSATDGNLKRLVNTHISRAATTIQHCLTQLEQELAASGFLDEFTATPAAQVANEFDDLFSDPMEAREAQWREEERQRVAQLPQVLDLNTVLVSHMQTLYTPDLEFPTDQLRQPNDQDWSDWF